MVSLLNTEDETILRRVKEDFKTLKLPIPSKPPAKETTREEAEEKLSTQKPAHEERPRNVRGNHSERAADKSKIYKVEKIP